MLSPRLRAFSDLLPRALRLLDGPQRRGYARSLAYMFLSSLLELVTIGLLIPFIGTLVQPGTPAWWTRWSLPALWTGRLPLSSPGAVLGVGILLMFMAKNLLGYRLYAHYNRFVFSIAAELSKAKLQEFYRIPFVEHAESNTAETLRDIAFIPIEFAQHLVLGSMIILSEGMLILLFSGTMAFIQFRVFALTLGVLLPFAGLAWALSVRYLRTTRGAIQQRSDGNLRTLSGALSAYQEVLLHGQEAHFSRLYEATQVDLNAHLARLNAANAIPSKVSETFAVGGMLLILFFYFRTGEHLTTPVITVLTLFVAFTYRMIPSLNKIMNAAVHLHSYSFTLDRILPVLGRSRPDTCPPGRPAPLPFREAIDLRHLTFRYPSQTEPVLKDLSLRIGKGDFIGIVGPSGRGKTSLARVLLQLVPQTSGEILLDGQVLADSQVDAWQGLFSYVSQDPVMLQGSFRSNVAFGVDPGLVAEPKVLDALRRAGLLDHVSRQPLGLEAPVGESGQTLSGGQKQRLAIARALYQDAQIILLDEALNGLDRAASEALLDLLGDLHRAGRTLIIITHHPAHLRHCTALYQLREGRLEALPEVTEPPEAP